MILRDRVKGLNILESLALLGLGSAGDLLKGWVSAVVDLLGLEVREDASGADDVVVRDVDVLQAWVVFEKIWVHLKRI